MEARKLKTDLFPTEAAPAPPATSAVASRLPPSGATAASQFVKARSHNLYVGDRRYQVPARIRRYARTLDPELTAAHVVFLETIFDDYYRGNGKNPGSPHCRIHPDSSGKMTQGALGWAEISGLPRGTIQRLRNYLTDAGHIISSRRRGGWALDCSPILVKLLELELQELGKTQESEAGDIEPEVYSGCSQCHDHVGSSCQKCGRRPSDGQEGR